jgi:hypothetical protein
MTGLLFDTPWWLPTLIFAAGAWMLFDGNRRGNGRLRNAGAGVVLLALVLAAVSCFVSTDTETCLDRTVALVDSVEKQDWPRFESLVDEKTSFAGSTGRAELVGRAKAAVSFVGLKNVRVTSTVARQSDTAITVNLSAISEQEIAPYPLPSHWELDWQQRGDRWLLYRVTLLNVGGQSGDEAVGRLPSGK